MILNRYVISFIAFLLLTTFSWAENVDQGTEEKTNQNRKSFCRSYPGNIIVGAGEKSLSAGIEFVFGDNIFYCSEQDESENRLPNHFLIWTMHVHYSWIRKNSGGFFLQPNLQYIFTNGPRFDLTVGPEIGFWASGFKFDYGCSVRVGTLYNLLNVEFGYLVNTNFWYLHFVLKMSWGYPY